MNFSLYKHLKMILVLFPLCFLITGCDEPGFQLNPINSVETKIPKQKNRKHSKFVKRKIISKKKIVPIDSSLSKLILPEKKYSSESKEILQLKKNFGELIKKQAKERNRLSESFNSYKKDLVQYKKETKKREKKQLDEILLLKKQNKILLSEIEGIKKKISKILVDKKQKESINLKSPLTKKSKLQKFIVGQPIDRKLGPVGNSKIVTGKSNLISKNNNLKTPKFERKLTKAEIDFKNALQFYRYGKSLKSSRVLFESFLNKYPNDILSDDAQFWIAKTFYLEKNFEQAILAFSKLQVDYPKGNRVPDSIFYEAMSYLNFGDKASAKELLSRLIGIFPNTDASKKAREKLKSF